jgi:hypothetical protein
MTEEDHIELHLEISRKVLAEFKQELESQYGVETAITGYTKAKKLKLIGTG